MRWTPTDEQVRELARAMQREMGSFLAHDPAFPDYFWNTQARAVLVAVGPHIAAQALRDSAGRVIGPSDTMMDASTCRTVALNLHQWASQIEQEAR